MPKRVNIAGFITDSLIDGPGVRFVVFFQGCPHHCLGCHNEETWDFQIKREVDIEVLANKWQKNKLIDGITFSGGEPFFQIEPLYELVKRAKADKLHIVIYTGYLYEQLLFMANEKVKEIMQLADILIDGPFIMDKKDENCKYRGSYNQRIINLKETLKSKNIIEYSEIELDKLFL